MRLPHVLFALLLCLCAVLLYAIFALPMPGGATGTAHPSFSTMLASGGPTLPAARWLGWVFGVLLISLMVGLLLLGLGRQSSKPIVRGFFLGSGFLILAAFTGLVLADASGDPADLFGSLPPATAWMLYGLWPVASLFLVWWAVRFREDIVTDEDLRIFDELMAKKQGEAQQGEAQQGDTQQGDAS